MSVVCGIALRRDEMRVTKGGGGCLLSIYLLGCSGDPTATDPQLILEDGFVAGREDTLIVAEGGTITGGFNAWLKLLPASGLKLRYDVDFSYQDCAVPVAWFNHVLQSPELNPDTSSLVCRGYSNAAFSFTNGRWFIEDRSRGYVYYRIWKNY